MPPNLIQIDTYLGAGTSLQQNPFAADGPKNATIRAEGADSRFIARILAHWLRATFRQIWDY